MASEKIRVLFFAKSRELCGCREHDFDAEFPISVKTLIETRVLKEFPQLSELLPSCNIAVNEEYIESANLELHPGDSVAITHEPISVETCVQQVSDDGAGAISTFIGTTRNTFDGKGVVELRYEAYESMARKEMAVIAERVLSKWPAVKHVTLWHRLGTVPVGQASVVIAVSSAHRADAIAACAFAIDDLKAHVPIWKMEVYEDGSSWKQNSESVETLARPFA
ncbi:Molybdopterin synthase catalytic subunit [Porphyridium purpureum]|uniref:Molybdopterin synthase catalytic subunit n=1 Tax=Porphyridium purpureum TaxID=35688 RepID=A0A5J4YZX0_PORPP|nr:Molybdopterin synthase catalytic subunit [Porphyridium purpureum]|eukprot:POR7010..scf208_2